MWRLPFLAYKTGLGAFIIIYCISLLTLANSIHFMEVFLGQFSGRTAASVYSLVPSATGIGIASIIYAILFTATYSQLIVYGLFYTIKGFNNPLPWTKEACLGFCDDPGLNFWDKIHNQNFYTIFTIIWVIISFKNREKMITPYLIIVIIQISILVSSKPNKTFNLFAIKLSHFANPMIWERAIEQSLYSIGVGMTTTIQKGTYAKFASTHIDSTIISFTILFFSILSAMTSDFSLGLISNPELGILQFTFISYSQALKFVNPSPLLSITFFGSFSLIGIIVVSELINSISKSVQEVFPKVNKLIIKFMVCLLSGFIGFCPLVRNNFEFFDRFVSGYSLMLIVSFELIFISFGYGLTRFNEDVAFMTNYYPNFCFRCCWLIGGLFIMLITLLDIFKSHSKNYLGILITFTIISPIFANFLYKIFVYYQNNQTLNCFKPNSDFGPKESNLKKLRKNFKINSGNFNILARNYNVENHNL